MASRPAAEPFSALAFRARCRCGHLPTHHMLVVPIGTSASFCLESSGPCAICGEVACRRYTPGAP